MKFNTKMKAILSIVFISVFIFSLIFIFLSGCSDNTTNPINNNLELLGFQDKLPVKTVWSTPYLYVCAEREFL